MFTNVDIICQKVVHLLICISVDKNVFKMCPYKIILLKMFYLIRYLDMNTFVLNLLFFYLKKRQFFFLNCFT